jgi:hypothetical protein
MYFTLRVEIDVFVRERITRFPKTTSSPDNTWTLVQPLMFLLIRCHFVLLFQVERYQQLLSNAYTAKKRYLYGGFFLATFTTKNTDVALHGVTVFSVSFMVNSSNGCENGHPGVDIAQYLDWIAAATNLIVSILNLTCKCQNPF